MKLQHLLPFAFLAVACTPEEEPTPTDSTPSTYAFTRDGNSSVSFSGQVQRQAMLTELSNYIKSGTSTALDFTVMENMYDNQNNPFADTELNTSGKSLSSKTSASATHVFDQGSTINYFKDWMREAAAASINPSTASAGVAGIVSSADGSTQYLVDSTGLEYAQMVQKGLMGAVLMDQMVNNYLTDLKLNVENDEVEAGKNYTVMEHHWDEAYGYFTIVEDLELDPSVTQARGFWGGYLVGLEDNFDYATDMYYAFRKGRQAIVNKNYTVRDNQIPTITDGMEEAAAIKAIGYLNKGSNSLNSGNVAAAFHQLSEGVGFIFSLRYSASELVSAQQSDQWIETLLAGNGFWEGDIQSRIQTVKTEIGAAFSFQQDIVDGTY